ncbi:hypothetical protein SAMN05216464_101630 [Mucilaginibacter pineti]|uniref:NACHT domain-containing protein n=1 Tax=Mucilaginibacter pineti TaxID=1391627 RepID=A0A1G6UF49_9SPHI|nr:hypothetical protein [Mucilaginibacter pineti]SDD40030.1 hypothetical protein SAMN05216464_101630 [Mucilaginibacter pineti]
MTATSSHLFELLKSCVLNTSNLKSITPSDCKVVSTLIFNKTKYIVSETTLKRIYGFAYSKFNPSIFTIDVMSKYCGYNGWDDFCEQQETKTVKTTSQNVDWNTLSNKAAKITNFTLQALKNKSGIPFSQSIKRNFIDDHFNEFLQGDYTATVFTAPSGYGKTIALCHWIDEKLEQALTADNNDIVLFFSSSALMSIFLSGRDLNDWLLTLLGYTPEEDVISLLDVNKRKEGNFYLVIDGFDEHMFKNDQFELMLYQLMDVFSFYQSQNWFKLVLTMRSSNWINNKHNLIQNNGKWFHGFVTDDQSSVNVPLFSIQEIKELSNKINPAGQNHVTTEIANDFTNPLYFQFYYKKHKDNFSLNHIDNFSIYDLISTFILNKVYMGHYATEKILLLRALVENMDFKNQVYDLDKIKVNDLLKQYSHAYNELLSIGFLKEINTSIDSQFNTQVQFGNSNFLEFSIAGKLLNDSNQQFDSKLTSVINELFANSDRKVPVLKWCVIHAIKNGQQSSFELLSLMELNPTEKSDLILFLGSLLEKMCSSLNNTESMANFFKQACTDSLFYYFFGLEFINVGYKKTLQTLLRFELSNAKKIITYTGLAAIALQQLDLNQLEHYIAKLKTFPEDDFQQFSINPLNCMDALYQHFKYGIVKKEFFRELTSFYFNPYQVASGASSPADDLVFLLAGCSLILCQQPAKILRFTKAVKKVHHPQPGRENVYNFFLNILEADANYNMGNTNKVTEIYDLIANSFTNEGNTFTPHMKSIFSGLKIKRALLVGDYLMISNYWRFVMQICDEHGHKLSAIFMAELILKNTDIEIQSPQLYKQIYYDYSKILRQTGLNRDILLKTAR